MLFSIQYPFADSRSFLNDTGRLEYPVWPLPTPDSEFVRYFGSIRIRKCGGVKGWVGEGEICEADRALRFSQGLDYFPANFENRIRFRCAFRRLYFDGKAVGKYEIGICPKKHNPLKLNKKQVRDLIDYFLKFPVQVRGIDETLKTCSLAYAARPLASLYAYATTSHRSLNRQQNKLQKWWVSPARPILFLEIGAEENIEIPFLSQPVIISEDYNFKLFHCLVPYKGSTFCLWILLNEDYPLMYYRPNYNQARALRISLLRLHAEHECLRLILRNLLNQRISIVSKSQQSDELQSYLNAATHRISRLENKLKKIFDTEIIELARNSFDVISPGSRDALLHTLEDIRKNIFRKVERYTEEWGNVEGRITYINGDIYNISQAGAAGRYARSDRNTFIDSEENKTLAETAAEIQQLLQQLERTNPSATDDEKITYVNDETTPSFKRRAAGALRAGGESAIKEFLDRPYVNVIKAVIKGWLKSE